ncbi:MAG: dihydroorotase [Bacteroidota bacterium]
MKWLIQQAKLFEPSHELHLQVCDLLIEDGIIKSIQKEIVAKDAEQIEGKEACLSIGWLDVGTQIGEPGYEHREDFESITAAAAAGGFTALATFPNTHPVIQSKAKVNFLRNYSNGNLVNFLPIGAATKDTAGQEMTEMYDMYKAGAVAFSDGKKSIQDTGMLLRVFQYTKAFDGIVINHPHDHFASHAQMHEGSVSTRLGLKGIPSLAEELMLQRDIKLLNYTEGRLHVHNISTAKSVHIIRSAKKRNLKVTASVAALNLLFNHEALADFDPNFKVLPPLREESDRKALIEGLQDGTIDFITSNHVPYEVESKFLQFSYAEFGVIGLETAFSNSLQALKEVLNLEEIIEKWAYANRRALGIDIPIIKVGELANLTLFHPERSWKVEEKSIRSKSKNSPFIGQRLLGKTLLTVNKGKLYRY